EEGSDMTVRGARPLETLFAIDNMEVPNINSFAIFGSGGGPVTLLDPTLLRDVTFLPGGYPASYINRLSSVLQIALREGDRDHVKAMATAGVAGAGGILEGPIGRNTGGTKAEGAWVIFPPPTLPPPFPTRITPLAVPTP